MGTLAESPSLIPTLEPAEPRTGTPGGITSTSLLISGFPGLWRERLEEEILIKGPEVGRRMEKFQGGVAIHCHLRSPQPEPAILLVAFSNVCSTALCEVPSVSSTQGTRGNREAELQAGLRVLSTLDQGERGLGVSHLHLLFQTHNLVVVT